MSSSDSKDEPPADEKDKPQPAAPEPELPAALPHQEMGFSPSTLHWLEDGDVSAPVRQTGPVSVPSFDPTAPVAGRKRAVLVVGGASIVALLVTGVLFVQARQQRAARPAAVAVADPARALTARAEAAFTANRLGEAQDLARLALVADPRFADAHFVVGNIERAHNRRPEARDAYRRYLELAPLGVHAEEARAALASLAP